MVNLFLNLEVNLGTFPEGADRDDARECGYLEISPYWEKPYDLIYEDGEVQYRSLDR
jgi:hypothetical protein